jgi:hypothetical protein
VEIVTADIERALNYIALLTNAGYAPTCDEVDTFVTSQVPKPSTSTSKILHSLSSVAFRDLFGEQWVAGDKVTKYMTHLGWLRVTAGNKVHLTASGLALLEGLSRNDESDTNGVRVYTSTPERPIAVSQLVTLMQQHNSDTYIDPHLDADHIEYLFTHTPITKILTSDSHLKVIRVRLAELRVEQESKQVRVLRGESLHDRAVLHEDGGIALIGTSFKKIESKVVGLVDLPASLASSFRQTMEELWAQAEVVLPVHPDAKRK